MKKILLFSLITFISVANTSGANLKITNFEFSGRVRDSIPTMFVTFTVSWENAWNTEKNHDAAWIFFKIRHQNELRIHRPAYVKSTGHTLIHNYLDNKLNPSFYVPSHKAGILIYPSQKYRGNISWRVKIELDMTLLRGIDFANNTIFGDVFGLEMVQVPKGAFFAGESDTTKQNRESAFFHYPDKKRFPVNSEKEIQIGKEESALYYNNMNVSVNRGDMAGPVPDSFPKGYNEFYAMKYEMSQGNYADFLNTLSNQPSYFRSNFGGKTYYDERGQIKLVDGRYIVSLPNRPANYTSWDDGCAFADWAGLRPMSELEFEKASRGPANTLAGDYPWGTNSHEKISRYYNREGDLVLDQGLSEQQITDNTLDLYGASYYWIMDLGGSLWERVATVGSAKGRLFKGSHGDGLVDQFGNATNADWPNEADGGFGYRGGGTYGFGMAFGPSHTTISARTFGSWGDGPRSVAYGFRAALTVR